MADLKSEQISHAPVKAFRTSDFPGWVFIACACGENPIANVWIEDHWQGGATTGEQAIRDLIAKQAKEASNA